MAKLICLLVLALAACMVAGLPHQDVNKMLHRAARAADPSPQYPRYGHHGHGNGNYGYGYGDYDHGYGHGHDHHDHGHFDLHCPHGHHGDCHYDYHGRH